MNVYGNPNGFETGSPQQNGSHGVEGGSMNSVAIRDDSFLYPIVMGFYGLVCTKQKGTDCTGSF
jgi:hypothetical protein